MLLSVPRATSSMASQGSHRSLWVYEGYGIIQAKSSHHVWARECTGKGQGRTLDVDYVLQSDGWYSSRSFVHLQTGTATKLFKRVMLVCRQKNEEHKKIITRSRR